ncbi:MAG: InlB B-repeat-containing protein [Bacilli bacterium]|nr:InlB B-repeat-containing protein [Bacilli bacterium]
MSKKVKIGLIIGIIFCITMIVTILLVSNNKSYTIKFDSNGGTAIENQIVKKGDKIVKPIDPTKDGYKFEGWYLYGDKYYFDKEVTKSFKLKAKWIKQDDAEKVTITFDTNGGSKISSIEITKGEKLNKPADPTKDGYVFIEWLLNNNSFNFDVEIVSDIKLVASFKKLEEDTFTVTFDSKGGSSVATQTVKKDEKSLKPADPTRDGYKFNGWYLNNKKYDFNTKITGNITLIAKWTSTQTNNQTQNNTQTNTQKPAETPQTPQVVKYNVVFHSDGGSAVSTQVVTAGAKATKPENPTRTGYKFVGWMLNGGAYNFNTPVNNNITLTAAWELIPVPDVYTVKMGLIDGDETSTERKVIVYKNNIEITASQLINQDGRVIGGYVSSLGAIRVNKSQYESATSLKVKLNDGTTVSANKG